MTSLTSGAWILILVWLALYFLDNYLTVYVARLYATQDPRVIHFESGYELTPQYQDEIKRLKLVGPRFIRSVLITTGLLSLVWLVADQGWSYPELYIVAMGAVILLASVVNLRHLQNIPFFKFKEDADKPQGEIFYPYGMIYRGSAYAFLVYAGFFLFLGLLEGSWFFIGGTLSCLASAFNHYRLAVRKRLHEEV
jgi:hypothetical protein